MSTLSMTELTEVRDALAGVLGGDAVNQLGRETGQATRLRTVTPHRLFLAIVSALAGAQVESLADVLRAFNYQNGVQVAYKAFCNRLAREGFEACMRAMCERLIVRLRVATLAAEGERAVARFRDIVIQDGSSFALNPALRDVFPGRFTTIEPAAVEIHATSSGFASRIDPAPRLRRVRDVARDSPYTEACPSPRRPMSRGCRRRVSCIRWCAITLTPSAHRPPVCATEKGCPGSSSRPPSRAALRRATP